MRKNALLDIHADYTWTLVDAKTGQVKQEVTCSNIILDQWITRLTGEVRLSYSSNMAIQVGTGSTTPAQTDTTLANYLAYTSLTRTSVVFLNNGINEFTYTGTFAESAAVGSLTEFGLALSETNSTTQGILRSRALITDSEHNPITIVKTNADILNVSVKLYAKVVAGSADFSIARCMNATGMLDRGDSLAGTELNIFGDSLEAIPAPPDVMSEGGGNNRRGGFVDTLSGLSYLLGYNPTTSLSAMVTTKPALSFIQNIISYWGYGGAVLANMTTRPDASSWNPWQGFVRWTSDMLASTSGNLDHSVLIKAFNLGSYGMWIPFPNHTLYPPKQMTFTFSGDGATDEFSVDIPELMTSGVVVKIDGVTQDPSTYTFSGKNFDLAQAWVSLDSRYLTHSGEYYPVVGSSSSQSTYYGAQLLFPQSASNQYRINDSANVITQNRTWDFGSPRTVNTFANTLLYHNRSDHALTAILEYSNDGTTWTEAARISLANQVYETKTFSPITARYWRLSGTPISCSSGYWDPHTVSGKDSLTGVFCAFDNVEPWLKFNQAPAAGSVITVTAYCEYPMKNDKWRIDPVVLDIAVERGT